MAPITKEEALRNYTEIEALMIVVHTLGAVAPQLSDNHWSIVLKLPGQRQRSIRMSMEQEQDDDPTGILRWSEHNYWISHSVIKTWEFNVPNGLCVCHVADLLYENGRHLYQFSGGGSGCRYWVWTIIHDLIAKGWFNQEVTNILEPQLQLRWHTSQRTTAQAWVQGQFYTYASSA
ncbi:hypothetical protein FH972_021717 [Carpinus fangiana]|uniref:DUF7770 domain-containing protein n=1 Tax=Carpinus fangiana TaxID=176857 RepID=A0A5N6KQ39_9ROSI|nr:hypothetical protein FH972_021717 [Carpinus fangiana]